MTKNYLGIFSIKRMWELLLTLRFRWAFHFSDVVSANNEMSTTHVAIMIG